MNIEEGGRFKRGIVVEIVETLLSFLSGLGVVVVKKATAEFTI